jgi:hypothetical protein
MAVPVLALKAPQIPDLEISADFSSSHFSVLDRTVNRPQNQSGHSDKNKAVLLCQATHFTNPAVISHNSCQFTSMCMDGCVLLPLALPATASSESLAGDPVISAAGDVLY